MDYAQQVIDAIVSLLDNDFDDSVQPALKYSASYTEDGFKVNVSEEQYGEDYGWVDMIDVATVEFKAVR